MKSSKELLDAFDALGSAIYDGSKKQIKEARNQLWLALENSGFRDSEPNLFLIDAFHDAVFTGIGFGRGDEGLSTSDDWRDGDKP